MAGAFFRDSGRCWIWSELGNNVLRAFNKWACRPAEVNRSQFLCGEPLTKRRRQCILFELRR